jgi:hypothetical protein
MFDPELKLIEDESAASNHSAHLEILVGEKGRAVDGGKS